MKIELYPKQMSVVYIGLILLAFILGPVIGVSLAAKYYADQKTVGWYASIVDVEGDPIPEDMVAKYSVYIAPAIPGPEPDTFIPDLSRQIQIAESILNTQHLITFEQKGEYFFGVAVELWTAFDTGTNSMLNTSIINWSNDPANTSIGEPISIAHYLELRFEGGMKIE